MTTKENILIDVLLQDIVDEIGIPKDKIIQHAHNGYVYDKRYVITRRLLGDDEILERMADTRVDKGFEKEWDAACLRLNPKARFSR
jgi:hypothetical protein